jgi:hypothetical protein
VLVEEENKIQISKTAVIRNIFNLRPKVDEKKLARKIRRQLSEGHVDKLLSTYENLCNSELLRILKAKLADENRNDRHGGLMGLTGACLTILVYMTGGNLSAYTFSVLCLVLFGCCVATAISSQHTKMLEYAIDTLDAKPEAYAVDAPLKSHVYVSFDAQNKEKVHIEISVKPLHP